MLLRLKAEYDDLVNEILNKIPQNKLIHGRVLDPSMGGGQFMKEIERRKREAGLSLDKIKKTCYGYADGQLALNYVINKNGLVGTYKIGNFLKEDIDMKFDVIVGNPPFQDISKNVNVTNKITKNLWSEFLAKSISDLSTSDGVVAMITPTTWLTLSSDLKGNKKLYGKYDRFWDYFNTVSTYANVTDVKKHFNNIGSTFGYVIVDKGGNNKLTFSNGQTVKFGFLPKKDSDLELLENSIDTLHNLNSKFRITTSTYEKLRVRLPRALTLNPQSVTITSSKDELTDENGKIHQTINIYVPDLETAKKVKQVIINSIDVIEKCKFSGYRDQKLIGMLKYT